MIPWTASHKSLNFWISFQVWKSWSIATKTFSMLIFVTYLPRQHWLLPLPWTIQTFACFQLWNKAQCQLHCPKSQRSRHLYHASTWKSSIEPFQLRYRSHRHPCHPGYAYHHCEPWLQNWISTMEMAWIVISRNDQ